MSYQSRVKTWIAGEVLYASDLNAEFDAILATLIPEPDSEAQGDILYRGASTWDRLGAGTSGYFLKTQGASANPVWADISSTCVANSLFDAHTVLYATTDDTPAALTVGEQTVVGRITGGNIAALTVAQLQALVFSTTLPEDTKILLDAALSADGKYCAIEAISGTAGTALSFGKIVYFASADSKWELADADAEATTKPLMGIVVVGGAENAAVTIMLRGFIREDDWAWTTPGAPLFLGTTAGGLLEDVTNAPSGSGDCLRIVGYVIDSNSAFICPENAWDELA